MNAPAIESAPRIRRQAPIGVRAVAFPARGGWLVRRVRGSLSIAAAATLLACGGSPFGSMSSGDSGGLAEVNIIIHEEVPEAASAPDAPEDRPIAHDAGQNPEAGPDDSTPAVDAGNDAPIDAPAPPPEAAPLCCLGLKQLGTQGTCPTPGPYALVGSGALGAYCTCYGPGGDVCDGKVVPCP